MQGVEKQAQVVAKGAAGMGAKGGVERGSQTVGGEGDGDAEEGGCAQGVHSVDTGAGSANRRVLMEGTTSGGELVRWPGVDLGGPTPSESLHTKTGGERGEEEAGEGWGKGPPGGGGVLGDDSSVNGGAAGQCWGIGTPGVAGPLGYRAPWGIGTPGVAGPLGYRAPWGIGPPGE